MLSLDPCHIMAHFVIVHGDLPDLETGASDYWDALFIYDDFSSFIRSSRLWLCHRDNSPSNSSSVRNQQHFRNIARAVDETLKPVPALSERRLHNPGV